WSFGVFLWENMTLGAVPYPEAAMTDMLSILDTGGRLPQPDNCSDEYYATMKSCWHAHAEDRPDFSRLRQELTRQLEEIAANDGYLRLDPTRDYYLLRYL
ncbi:hypothetical protein AAVH_31686, partial [Aphelenchoides avenae]